MSGIDEVDRHKSIGFGFALKVQELNRRGLNVPAIARSLGVSEEEVMDAHRMLYLPVNDTDAPSNVRTDAERLAELERMPKKMQDRIRRSRGT